MNLLPILLSISPISELRGGIPAALALGMPAIEAFLICVLANIAIILPVWLFFDFLHSKLLSIRIYKKFSDKILKRIMVKSGHIKENMLNFGYLALTIFVAIPLPMTGAYTGTIIAWLLKLDRKKSFIAVAAGVIIAGIVVTLASAGVLAALR
ncbi:small multi-drug export protein [bacterium]|nr:small multi-drug export protein [bacterium]